MHCVYIILEEESQCHLPKMVKVDVIQDHRVGTGTTAGGFYSGGETGNKAWARGDSQPRSWVGAADVKLLRGNPRGKGVLAKASQKNSC